MLDNVKRFQKAIRENAELEKRLIAELKRIAENKEAENDAEALAKAAQALGYDFTAADLEKARAEAQELDPAEMVSAAGGGCCFADYACFTVYHHDGTGKQEACVKEYSCITVYQDSKIEGMYKDGTMDKAEKVKKQYDELKKILKSIGE